MSIKRILVIGKAGPLREVVQLFAKGLPHVLLVIVRALLHDFGSDSCNIIPIMITTSRPNRQVFIRLVTHYLCRVFLALPRQEILDLCVVKAPLLLLSVIT